MAGGLPPVGGPAPGGAGGAGRGMPRWAPFAIGATVLAIGIGTCYGLTRKPREKPPQPIVGRVVYDDVIESRTTPASADISYNNVFALVDPSKGGKPDTVYVPAPDAATAYRIKHGVHHGDVVSIPPTAVGDSARSAGIKVTEPSTSVEIPYERHLEFRRVTDELGRDFKRLSVKGSVEVYEVAHSVPFDRNTSARTSRAPSDPRSEFETSTFYVAVPTGAKGFAELQAKLEKLYRFSENGSRVTMQIRKPGPHRGGGMFETEFLRTDEGYTVLLVNNPSLIDFKETRGYEMPGDFNTGIIPYTMVGARDISGTAPTVTQPGAKPDTSRAMPEKPKPKPHEHGKKPRERAARPDPYKQLGTRIDSLGNAMGSFVQEVRGYREADSAATERIVNGAIERTLGPVYDEMHGVRELVEELGADMAQQGARTDTLFGLFRVRERYQLNELDKDAARKRTEGIPNPEYRWEKRKLKHKIGESGKP